MKICTTCHLSKPFEEFNKWKRSKDGRQPRCRDCTKQWYRDNSEQHLVNTRAQKAKMREEYAAKLVMILKVGCIDCGENDPVVLDFDHRDPADKTHSVSELLTNLRPWALIELEIAKCDIRCANCHRKRTARQFGWRKALLTS